MKTINDSHAYSTMFALLTAYRAGKDYISSEDYPFLPVVLESFACGEDYLGVRFVRSRERKTVGFNVEMDLYGNEIRRKPIEKVYSIYHFDPSVVSPIIKGMQKNHEVDNMLANAAFMTKLASLIQGE